MNSVYEKLLACYESIKDQVSEKPLVGLVLGSGLGGFADEIEVTGVIDYNSIQGFPISTVAGHKGQYVFGKVCGVRIVAMQGRVHYYEGYPMSDVVLPIRLMKLMGTEILLLTNAAGGVNTGFKAGDLMLIKDQITALVPSPLIGPNIDELGVRFPDMSQIYDLDLSEAVLRAASEQNIHLQEGNYMQFTGPAYESPAEIVMARGMGADAVGMSTACEAVAAVHMGMRVCGISCISNLAAGMSGKPLDHKEVQEIADKVSAEFKGLVAASIEKFAQL